MALTCRIYGHNWRRPGPFQVVVDADGSASVPYRCEQCGQPKALGLDGPTR